MCFQCWPRDRSDTLWGCKKGKFRHHERFTEDVFFHEACFRNRSSGELVVWQVFTIMTVNASFVQSKCSCSNYLDLVLIPRHHAVCLEYAALALSTCVYHLCVAGQMEFTNEARHRFSEPKHTQYVFCERFTLSTCRPCRQNDFQASYIGRWNLEKDRIPLWLGPIPTVCLILRTGTSWRCSLAVVP